VGAWLAPLGIAHRALPWIGEKPASGVQAAARAARYRLLLEACRAVRVEALLLGHQQEDQAETFLMRLARGGGDGLAAMAPGERREGVRLLRPLLGIPRARLTATLESRGQAWLDDPSNADARFERTRLRTLVATLGAGRLAAAAATARDARAPLDAAAAALAARSVTLHPAGWAILEPVGFAGDAAAARALRHLLHGLGGGDYAPAPAAVRAALPDLGRRGRTLGRCRMLVWRGLALVCRENRGLPPAAPVPPGARVAWDRFAVELGPAAPVGLALGALGSDRPAAALAAPAAARSSLPCLRRGREVVALPGLEEPPAAWRCRLGLRSAAALARIGFRVA